MDTKEDLIALRAQLGVGQLEMAHRMGMAKRTLQDIEGGIAQFRSIHGRAAERAALDIAVERKNPALAPASIRKQALELARLITEG